MRNKILQAAIELASQPGGWTKLTRYTVAQAAGCADGTVSLHFGTMVNFKRDIMRAAIKARNLSIIAQGIASGDKHALKVDASLKLEALKTL